MSDVKYNGRWVSHSQLEEIKNSAYEAGLRDASKFYTQILNDHYEPINEMVSKIVVCVGTIRGAAIDGQGLLLRETIHQLSGLLAGALKMTEDRIMRASFELRNPAFADYCDFSEAHKILAYCEEFYSTGSASSLRSLQDSKHPVIINLIALRPKLLSGFQPQDAINLICERVAQVYNQGDISQVEAADNVYNDLYNRRDDLIGGEREMWEKITDWTDPVENMVKNTQRKKLFDRD